MADAVLTGPIVLPGDATPVAGCPVKVKLVAGSARTPGFVGDAAVQGEWQDVTDESGQFSVSVPTLVTDDDTANFPGSDYYLVTVGGGAFPTYAVKVKPTTSGSWVYSDPEIRVYVDAPSDFVYAQPKPTAEQVATAVDAFLDANPVDVVDEVAAALTANPPLYPAQNLSDVASPSTALTNLGGYSASAASTALATVHSTLDPLVLANASDPFVQTAANTTALAAKAPLASPALTGNPTAPTPTAGDNDTSISTTAFVTTAVANEATARNTAIGVETTRATTAEALLAPLASPALTGNPTVPTQTAGNSSTRAASTAFVGTAVANEATARDTAIAVETSRATTAEATKAPLASPALTGTPTVPTAAQGTNTTQAASTAYVQTEVGLLIPKSTLTTNGNLLTRTAGAPAEVTRAALAADSAFTSAFQALAANLTAVAGLTTAANKLIYWTGSGAASTTDLTAAGRALIDDADATAQRATLGLGTLATKSTVASADITDGTIVDGDVNASAAIATSKVAQDQGITGGNSGHVAIGTLTNANVASGANIALSKVAFGSTGATVAAATSAASVRTTIDAGRTYAARLYARGAFR